MNADLENLVTELKVAHIDFLQTANQLDEEKYYQSGVCGEWSPKKVVAHLTGWDESLKTFIVDIDNFIPPHDVHDFNKQSVLAREAFSWEEAIHDCVTNFAELESALLTVNVQMKIYPRVLNWVLGRIEDYHLHQSQLAGWLHVN